MPRGVPRKPRIINNAASEFPNRVGHFRVAAGLSQSALANHAGVADSLIRSIEGGKAPIPLALANKLGKVLNVEPDAFKIETTEAHRVMMVELVAEASQVKPEHQRYALAMLKGLKRL